MCQDLAVFQRAACCALYGSGAPAALLASTRPDEACEFCTVLVRLYVSRATYRRARTVQNSHASSRTRCFSASRKKAQCARVSLFFSEQFFSEQKFCLLKKAQCARVSLFFSEQIFQRAVFLLAGKKQCAKGITEKQIL